ncbi:MAG: hypothetical protein IK038_03250 [Bacteroidaceae bacterium]|nr:hypothetical protein [Bacteroidaceae bacterium]
MSTKIYDAYLYDKTEDELILELNAIRKAYLSYLKDELSKNAERYMECGKAIYDDDKEVDEHLLRKARRYLERGTYTMEKGHPLDMSGDCVIVKHDGKIVVWLFPGYQFGQFAKTNEILQRIKKNEYWWQNQSDVEFDTPEEEEEYDKRGEFWDAVFAKYNTGIPSQTGLSYSFFHHDDIFKCACILEKKYTEKLQKNKKAY